MNKLLPSVKSLITLAALLCFLFQASAASAQKVSLSVRNATVKAAIERLQKDYGYSFVIKTKDADVNKKITLDVKNEEIGAVVGKMFAGQNVVSSVEGKMIAIMSAPAKRDAAARASANAVVKGVVKDSAGNPITGATVIVDGTTIGATTDLDGSFSVRIGARTDVRLIVSYLGLKTREVAVDDPARFYEVRLENDNMALDEVVVVGYGTQRRSLVTNAISQFKPTEENMRSVMSPSELLQGRIAGVSISTSSGNLGSAEKMSIRGSSSLSASNEPLYVIDGIPLSNNSASLYSFGENMSSLATLNLTDIESIEVLKDAASAGIYGARASNGVILITTKKGSMARGPQVTFEAQAAWTSPAVRFDLMDGGDYLRTMRTMLNEYPSTYAYGSGILTGANSAGIGNGDNSVWTPKFVDTPADVPAGWKVMVDPIDHSKLIAYQDNDQQKQWFDDSYWMNYYVGVNGGNDKVQYAASAGYTKDGGIGINTDFSRFTFHGNTSFKILRNLKATTVFDYSETKGNTLPSSGIATYWTTVGRGMFMPATHRDYLDDGTPAQGTNNTTISAAWFDRYYTSNYTARRMTANFNLEWEIVDGLRAVMQVANHNYYRIDNQRLAGNAISNQRRTYEKWGQTNRFSTQGYLNYRKTFAQDHTIEGTVGFDYMKNTVNGLSLTVTGADSDKVPTLAAGTDATGWADTNTNEALSSYFGRLNYDYKKKYLFMFTFRADGSSKFAEGNRWGYFPAASAGWVVSEEKFWNVRNFNSFKIRASYGLTGNNYIGLYDAYGGFGATSIYNGASAILPTALPNMRLKWETTHQLDIGVDMGFFNDRIRLMADYYNKKTTDLLFSVTLPDTSGYGSARQNVGSVRFYGAEVELSTVNIQSKNFTWTTDFTYSFNMNKVLSLPDEYKYKDVDGKDAWRIGGYTMSETGFRFGGTAVGERMGRIYGYKTAYIIETEAQADAALYDVNSHGIRRSDGRSIAGRKDIGDYEWLNRAGSARTADGSEQINDEDMFLLGYVTPHSTGGMNNTFKYRNLSLSVYVDYALGHSVYNYMYTRGLQTSMGNCNWNLIYDANDCWQKPGDNTKLARLSANDADGGNKNYSRISDINVQKGDYLCLRDVTLSYSFPKRWIGKLGLGNLTVSVSGNTLVYWTKVKGVSPESAVASSGSSTGMYSVVNTSSADYNIYPPTRKVMFSLKATF